MKPPIVLAFLACWLASGCREATAPTVSKLAGTWRVMYSLSGGVNSTVLLDCSGVLDLTLTQADTVLTGTYTPPSVNYLCQPTEFFQPPLNGWNWGFLPPYTVTGMTSASGGFRLAVAVHPTVNPDSLVFVGRVASASGDGSASSAALVISDSAAMTNVPLTGMFVLYRPAASGTVARE